MRELQRKPPGFPMNHGHFMTLEECAAHMGVSKERARQIELAALRKLRIRLKDWCVRNGYIPEES